MRSPFLPGGFLACFLLASCGGYEARVTTSEAPGDEAEVLSLTASASDFFCPTGFAYNATSRLCESATEAVGPFTVAMIKRCNDWGGGSACSKERWSRDFARKVRGTDLCPVGAARDAMGLCVEGTEAYGPFPKSYVALCKETHQASVCEGMRWAKSEATRIAVSIEGQVTADRFTFPFSGPADADYTVSPRNFGACRDGCARKHAGVDLYGAIGRSIYAVGDGEVLDFHYFYDGTYALVVDHGDFVVRYGEVKSTLPSGVFVGAKVVRGQRIASVGDLASLSINMLHFERFSGAASGPLTVRNNPPYQRRSDLQNGTADLIKWKYPR